VYIPTDVPEDIVYALLSLFVIQILIFMIYRRRPISWVERGSIYTLMTIVCYISVNSSGHALTAIELILFVALTIVVIIGVRYSKLHEFKLSTLDFLVILSTLTISNIPYYLANGIAIGDFLIRLIILYYAIELIISQLSESCHAYLVRIGVAGFAGLLSISVMF
jgi:hypothetical protein